MLIAMSPATQPGQGSSDVVRRLRGGTDLLTTAALKRLDAEVPWYRELAAEDRSWIGLVAQSGIAAFITWYEQPSAATYNAAEIFRAAPPELTRSISLQHRSEEHTSELQSRGHLVCRLLLEKKKHAA